MLGVPSFPALGSPQRQGNSRNKVALKPGRSLMDWIRYGNSGADLQGFGGRISPVTLEELRKHNKEDDCWIAIRGRVYNITGYLEFHPGGIPEIMRGAGIDATDLFDEIHKWVNFSSMLSKCYIGPLKHDSSVISKIKKDSTKLKKNDGFLAPTGLLPTKPADVIPRYDWYEKDDTIVLSIYTKSKVVHSTDVILDCHYGKLLSIKVLLGEKYYMIHLALTDNVLSVSLQSVTGNKINISMVKETTSNWNSLGSGLNGHNMLHFEKDRELKFRECTITSVEQVSPDTSLFSIQLPHNVSYEVPIGHHVIVKADVLGMDIRRNYTVVLPSLYKSAERKTEINNNKLHLMIKCYEKGALTPVIHSLKTGDKISVSDCTGNFKRLQLYNVKKVFLIAAGTGFTPMIRIIDYYFSTDESNTTHVSLLFANKTERDILWRAQLQQLANEYPDRFRVEYILSQPSGNWSGLRGRIDQKIIGFFVSERAEHISKTSKEKPVEVNTGIENLFGICGSDEFTKSIKTMLLDTGVELNCIHCFQA